MSNTHRFDALLRPSGRGGGTLLDVPEEVSGAFGRRGRVPVRASVNGVRFRTSLMPAGGGRHCLGVTKAQLGEAGVAQGDRVSVELAIDTEPRVIEPPADLATALAADPAAGTAFAGLSYTHRREYVRWIEEAKRAETRSRRLDRAVELLRQGVRTPG